MFRILLTLLLVSAARSDHQVGRNGFGPGRQNWGYATVRPKAHLFWWLFYVHPPAVNQSVNFDVFSKPLIIWLQGGPGVSATGFGNFNELGPLDINLKPREHTWVNDYNVLFIDNPVGTGFSFVENESAFAKNNTQIAKDLVECVKIFLEAVPEFKNVSTYIVAESYGGKMGVEFALLWSLAQNSGSIESKLKGIAIGGAPISFSKVVHSIPFYLLNLGLTDIVDYRKIKKLATKIETAILNQKWIEAFKHYKDMWNIIYDVTDNTDVYNILKPKSSSYRISRNYNLSYPQRQQRPANVSQVLQELMEDKVRKKLNLSSDYNLYSDQVPVKLLNDFMKPVVGIVGRLLRETNAKVTVYTGQLDMVIPPSSTLSWMRKLQWKDRLLWRTILRSTLIVNDVIEGFIKEYGRLKLYWIMRAGHLAPIDSPYALKAILEDLTFENEQQE